MILDSASDICDMDYTRILESTLVLQTVNGPCPAEQNIFGRRAYGSGNPAALHNETLSV
jgi:hypothetical protein